MTEPGMMNYQGGGDVGVPMAPDEAGVEQGFSEDDKASVQLAIEQFPAVGMVIEQLMNAAAPPTESPEDTVKANLEPGEFVFTADAVKEIGIGKLQSMMEKAEQGFMEKTGGKPVEGGAEMAYSAGGYVNDNGQRGFMEDMYAKGKETQAKYAHKDSGMNYSNGGVTGIMSDYHKRIKEQTEGSSSSVEEVEQDPYEEWIMQDEEIQRELQLQQDRPTNSQQKWINQLIEDKRMQVPKEKWQEMNQPKNKSNWWN